MLGLESMYFKIFVVTLLFIAVGVPIANGQVGMPPQDALKQAEPRLRNVTTLWVGNTWGGWTDAIRMPTGQAWPGLRGARIQPGIQALAVAPDGTVFIQGRGDGKRYAILHDGYQSESIDDAPYHIWFSSAAAVDDKYFYFAQRNQGRGNGTEKTSTGGPKYTPPGGLWTTVVRLDRTGRFAPFPGGFGDYQHGLVVDKSGEHLRGLTADNQGRLYVSLARENRVVALDRETMQPVTVDGKPLAFTMDRPDRLAYDSSRQWVWAVSQRELETEERSVRIRAGGDRIGDFARDFWRWKGTVVPIKGEVDLSKVARPAPAELYSSAFLTPRSLYKLNGFAPDSAAKVRLHMVEPNATKVGERVFGVRINNEPVLAGFDLFKEIGGVNRAVVKEFDVRATGEGEIAIDFDAGKGGKTASISAIEVFGRRVTGRTHTPARIVPLTRDLQPAGDPIVLISELDLAGLTAGPDGMLYVADNGQDLNIKVFDPSSSGKMVRTIGVKGGMLAGPVPGTLGPDRYAYLTDIGADAAGNLYLAQDGNPIDVDISGATLSCLRPDGAVKWLREGLMFMDEPDWDRGPDGKQENILYSAQRKFLVNADGRAGENWKTVAFTHDRFRYPNDLRSFDRALDRDAVYVRYVEGKKFMIVAGTGSAGKPLAIYRFEPNSEIAIPCGAYGPHAQWSAKFPGQPEHGEWFWTDSNGDGDYQPDEFKARSISYVRNDNFDGPVYYGMTVDSRGGLWLSNNERFIRYFKPIVTNGALSYSFADSHAWKIPSEFNKNAGRISYDAERDLMFLSGALPASQAASMTVPGLEQPEGRVVGNCISRFDGWLKSAEGQKDPSVLIAPPAASWVREIPFDSTRNIDRHAALDLPSMLTAEGDYVFVGYARLGRIRVYHADSGEFAGMWEMGPSLRVEDPAKGNQLSNSPLNYGLMDSPCGLRVMRRKDNSYLVTYHDNFLNHTTLYVWRPDAKPTAAVWDLSASPVDGGAVTLKWTAPEGATEYIVERLIASGDERWTVLHDKQVSPEFRDAPPATAKYMFYRLRSRSSSGDLSDYSNVLGVRGK